jgi:hypothetical protein
VVHCFVHAYNIPSFLHSRNIYFIFSGKKCHTVKIDKISIDNGEESLILTEGPK